MPKVENVDIITPSYSSGSVVKANDDGYNIFNTLPDVMKTVKEDIKDSEEVRKEVDAFVDTLSEVPETIKPVVSEQPVKNEEKANVNINVDDVVIDSNVITDDQFFDDFFADDE